MTTVTEETRLANFANASSEGIFIHDQGIIVDINPSITRIYGYSPEETIGRPLLSFVAPESQALVRESVAKGNEGPYEVVLLAKDGSRIHSEVRARTIEYQGRTLRAVALLDITQRKQAEKALKASEKKYHTLFNSIREGAFLFQGNKFVDCNEQACRLWACEREDIIGHHPLEFAPETQPDGRETNVVIEEKLFLLLAKQSQFFYFKCKRKDGVLIDTNITLKLIELDEEKLILASMEDITRERSAENRIRANAKRLRKLASLSLTSASNSSEMFGEVAPVMAEMLDVPVVCLSEIHDKTLKFVSIYADGKLETDVGSCALEITPCASVERTQDLAVFHHVSESYPKADLLRRYKAFSFCGSPVQDSIGKVTAIICLLDDKFHEFTLEDRDLLSIFSQRIGVELERLQTEKELNRRKAEFEAMFNAIPDAVMFADLQRRIVLTNPAVHKMFGYKNEELIGNTTEMLYADKEDYRKQGQLRYRQGKNTENGAYEVKYKHKNGSEFWTESLGTQVKDASGKPIGFIGLFRDITERKKSEEALRNSERHLANAQRLAHIGSWELDLLTNELKWSREVFNIFEIDPQRIDATYEIFLEAVHPDDREMVNTAYWESVKNHEPYQIEHRLLMPDGRVKYVLELCENYYDAQGKPLRSLGTVQDITDRINAENKIRYNEARLAESQEIARLGSWDFNIKTGEAIWSKEFYKLLGYTPGEVEASPANFFDRVHKDDLEYVKHELERPFKERDRDYQAEFRIVLPDNSIRIVSEQGKMIYDEKGEPWRYVGTTQDVTERRAQEEKLRRIQRMDALGKLTGGIAHDYNNLLGIISGYAELLGNEIDEDSRLGRYVRDIKKAVERGTRLTGKLLAFSKSKTFDTQVLSINTVLQEQQLILEKTLTARIRLEYRLTQEVWPVELDRSELEDAILNLCINAKHAMRDSGVFTIQTRNKHVDDKLAKELGLSTGDYVELDFSDTGIGMDNLTRERIFEPFFTTKGDSGTGLGLSQVYGFVKRSEGAIMVYSEPGQGSRFVLYFPKSRSKPEAMSSSIDAQAKTLQGHETILVVDDEQSMVVLLSDVLTGQGYHVLSASNGLEALELLDKQDKPVDLLISDVIMPEMDGYQLAAQVSKRYPDMKIQMVSGFADDRHAELEDETLHQNILYKPYSIDTLLARVRLLLDKDKTGEAPQEKQKDLLAGRTILVLDDDEDVQALYRLNLKKLGCSVLATGDEAEALQLYQQSLQNGKPLDAVIVDLSIPGGRGGRAVAEKIHSWNPQAKVIVSSGYSEGPEMTNYGEFGFQGALDKSFEREKIREVLEQVLGAGQLSRT